MIMLAAVIMGLLGQQPSTDTEGGPLVRTYRPPINGTNRCLRNLPLDRQVPVQIACQVNSLGGPTRCTFAPGVTREQRYAAECVARGYRFHRQNGEPATGATVRFTVRLITD